MLSQQPIRIKENIARNQWKLNVNTSDLPEARENACDQGAIDFSLSLIGWEGAANFLDQSHNEVKQIHNNPG